MKKILLFTTLLTSTICYSQKQAIVSNEKKAETFNKKPGYEKETYRLNGSVKIKNGKGENVMVVFTGSVPINIWNQLVKDWKHSEREYFSLVAGMLSIEAQYSLKNNLSFEPFNSQFFMYDDGKFVSSYKMMGRNGYGNQVETSAIVKWDPKEKND